MSTIAYDVVIIGGGMSGLMAAVTLADKGRKVAVISKGDPVCALSTSCIDLLEGEGDPLKNIKQLPKEHPYHLATAKGIEKAFASFQTAMNDMGLPYTGDVHHNRTILTPLGTRKQTCLVPASMEHGMVAADEYVHVISFKGIKDFYPSYITARHPNAGFSVYDAGVSTTMGLAERFEDEQFTGEFIAWLKTLEIPDGKIAVPALLGTRNPLKIFKRISSEMDRQVFEIPTMPPSIPGLRLFKALKNAAQKKGADLYWGKEIASVQKSDDHIEAVTLTTSGRPTLVQGRQFILASGSLVSGGLYASQHNVHEKVLDLPVFVPGERDTWFNDDFFAAGHAIEKAGIRVDKDFRPVDCPWSNLKVCGSILAYSEIMKYRCGHGLAIVTGVAAAEKCEEQLS